VAYFGSDRARIIDHLREVVRPGDIVLTQGAGDVSQLGPEILKALEADTRKGRRTC
jgi:UDP-N-acetylmuramate--alanine ligase